MLILGIDFGARRIGLATGNSVTGTARPLTTIRHDGKPLADIEEVVREWNPDRIVIGLPLAADGSETDMSRAARRFAADVQARFGEVAVEFQDERYSSRMADSQFARARREGRARRRDARNLDSVAAAIIVESWLAAKAPDLAP
ncbi:MAG: Holliday junction resolvase RuvX [Wenzhouxiangellaceae bacterium]